jgi:hypothetical protein
MPLAPLASAPRAIVVPLAATTVAPVIVRTSPFESGQSVLAQSAAAGDLMGACHPGINDNARYLKFKVVSADIAAASKTIGQVAAARDAAGNVTGDLTVSLGLAAAADQLSIGLMPAAAAIDSADLLGAIVLVNGVPYGRITDANAPNPGVGQWGLDDNTEVGTVLVIGASTGTNLIRVGTEIEIIKPDLTVGGSSWATAGRVCKPAAAAGAALVATLPEERMLALRVTGTDTAGRTYARAARVDFVAADVGAITILGLSK